MSPNTCYLIHAMKARKQESTKSRNQENKIARQQENKTARKQENKKTRKQAGAELCQAQVRLGQLLTCLDVAVVEAGCS